jgi:hypothetical protein
MFKRAAVDAIAAGQRRMMSRRGSVVQSYVPQKGDMSNIRIPPVKFMPSPSMAAILKSPTSVMRVMQQRLGLYQNNKTSTGALCATLPGNAAAKDAKTIANSVADRYKEMNQHVATSVFKFCRFHCNSIE